MTPERRHHILKHLAAQREKRRQPDGTYRFNLTYQDCMRSSAAAMRLAGHDPMPMTVESPGKNIGVDSLAELTEQMRGFVDLPVQDLARMCGIGRRQYYNLMRRKAETMKTAEGEQRLRLVHHYLRDLHMNLGNATAVRAAVLMPLPTHGARSLLDIGAADDLPTLTDAYRELAEELAAGARPSSDVLPPSGTFPPDDERWTEAEAFLRDHLPATN